MGLFGLFNRKKKPLPILEPKDSHLAFVLLPEARLPVAEDVIAAFVRFRGASETLTQSSGEDSADEESSDSAWVL